ncbi:hypothetical protein TrRE_jg2182 [Triparma retinervis]|uniref:Uncharacterized protein n=1 Tax=Triparma retinervis TaxID=2557542 RepID=A0A9W7FA77_9STRA|nr:hypothetical protein TrRE_jg2182 [Triparma retinervis]
MSKSWQISVPSTATSSAIQSAIQSAMEDKFEFSKSELGLKTQIFNEGGYASAPFAFVEPFFTKLDSRNDTRNDTRNIEPPDDMYNALCVSGLTINGVTCKVKMRRPSKRERQEKGRAKEAAKKAKDDSIPSPGWKPEMLAKFKMRAHTLDQQQMVGNLSSELKDVVLEYLRYNFPSKSGESLSLVIQALTKIWSDHPLSLRVKELFETVETFKQVESVVSKLRRLSGPDGVDNIFDMACGHGLLGVLLAHRFPSCEVSCVDLERRKAVHACNEANVSCLSIASKSSASYACMPCCIREGLYGISCRHLDDDSRHALLTDNKPTYHLLWGVPTAPQCRLAGALPVPLGAFVIPFPIVVLGPGDALLLHGDVAIGNVCGEGVGMVV